MGLCGDTRQQHAARSKLVKLRTNLVSMPQEERDCTKGFRFAGPIVLTVPYLDHVSVRV